MCLRICNHSTAPRETPTTPKKAPKNYKYGWFPRKLSRIFFSPFLFPSRSGDRLGSPVLLITYHIYLTYTHLFPEPTHPAGNADQPATIRTSMPVSPSVRQNGAKNGAKLDLQPDLGLVEKPNLIHTSLSLQQRTPPPDNWRHIQPCSHLTKVLATSAHDTVMATYKQAVGILVAVNPSVREKLVFRLKKDGLPLPLKTFLDLKHKVLRCLECRLPNFHQVFFCLQCPHVGCYQKHAREHAEKHNHMFATDAQNGLLFCFSCSDYINHLALNDIRLAVALVDEIPPNHEKSPASDHYTKPSALAVHGLKGIVNLGATCFMSAIIQTLLHNPLVRNHFFNNDLHFFNCNSAYSYLDDGQIDSSNACITCLVDAVFKQVYCATSPEGFGITTLLQTAWYKNQLLAGFSEQDAHEFWQFLLNEFHLDHERVLQNAGLDKLGNCTCITHSVFSGELESAVTCSSCGFVRKTVDPLVDLLLEVNDLNHENNTLYECLDQFTHNEALDVKSRCQSCGAESKPFRSLRLRKLPPVLSIQLKRFKHNHTNDTASKIEVRVETPLYLNLTKYVSEYDEADSGADKIDSGKIYELFAVVTHIGSVNTGHYVAFIKNSIGQWFKFDDSVVSHASHEEVQATNAYLLFYIAHFT